MFGYGEGTVGATGTSQDVDGITVGGGRSPRGAGIIDAAEGSVDMEVRSGADIFALALAGKPVQVSACPTA